MKICDFFHRQNEKFHRQNEKFHRQNEKFHRQNEKFHKCKMKIFISFEKYFLLHCEIINFVCEKNHRQN